jgi:multidrug efflux pump
MVLAIGLVVDDAIVVVENIHRHIEEGLSPFQAALKGAGELGGPVVAMTITLAAVYAPIGFMGGLTGSLFREFAFTLAGAVVISGIVALTLSPMMCSKMLKSDTGKKGFAHWLDSRFDALRSRYERLLHGTLNTRSVIVVFALIVFVACIPFLKFSKSELAPDEDQGVLMSAATASPNASIDQTAKYAAQVVDIFQSFPETENIFQVVGLGSTNSMFTGMVLKPWSQRPLTAMQLLPQVSAKLNEVAGIKSYAFLRPPLPGGGSGPAVQFVIKSTDDPLRIYEVANALVGEAMQSGMFYYADSDLKFDQPQVNLQIDRDKAADLGINMQQVAGDVGSMLGGGYVNFFDVQGRSYKVIPQVQRVDRLNPDQVLNYYVGTGSGDLVPLSSFASLEHIVQPQALKHFQQLNSATISAVPRVGVTQGDALKWFQDKAAQNFPAGYQVDYAGQSRQFMQEGSALLVTFVFALIIVFLVLAAQFESFRDPFIIMMTVPLAISGALAFLFLGFASLNIYTEVGLITLVGLITKHGILIVQFANQLQEEGVPKREAIERACGVRLRPVLMTTAAMVLGVMPLVLASGAGAASRYSMGLVIATGMSIGTLFTLFVIPTAYMIIAPNLKKSRAHQPAQ